MFIKCLKITLILAIIILLPRISMAIEKKAIFAGGCFWCMEEAFDKLEGVKNVISGYTGGDLKNPSYEEVTKIQVNGSELVFYDKTSNMENVLFHT